jgi:hypothetical protein
MIKKFLYISVLSVFITSCTNTPKEAYFKRGEPESLIDQSSEAIHLRVDSPANIQDMIDVINKDQPTRAELKCNASSVLCRDAKKVLNQFKIKTTQRPSQSQTVSLYYERVLARDCQNRFIHLRGNENNLQSPTIGCSVSANMLQMVSNKKQFLNPSIMSKGDSSKPIQAITNYSKPTTDFNFEDAIQTQISGGTGGR